MCFRLTLPCCCCCAAGGVLFISISAVVVDAVGCGDGSGRDDDGTVVVAVAAAASALPPLSDRIAATATAAELVVEVVVALLLRVLLPSCAPLRRTQPLLLNGVCDTAAGLLGDSNAVRRSCLTSLTQLWDEHGSTSNKAVTGSRDPRMVMLPTPLRSCSSGSSLNLPSISPCLK